MNVRIAPFGAAGWKEKQRVLDAVAAAAGRELLRYDDVLVIVPTSRLRRTYGRLFLDLAKQRHGRRAVVPPRILTLPQLIERLASRLGAAPLIDENSRLILFEGIVKELIAGRSAFGDRPDLLAPSLAAAAAGMAEDLAAAGVPPARIAAAVQDADIAGRPQVALLIEAYDRYARTLSAKGLVDPAALHGLVAERFDPSWLESYRSIVIDGLHQAGVTEAAILRKVAALDTCTVILEAPSADGIRNAGDHHPLRLIRDLAARTGLLLGREESVDDADGRFLAGALFSDRSFAEAAAGAPADFGRDLRLLSAVTVRAEVALIARSVKASISAGTPPDSILVAFPSLDEYGPLAEEVFTDLGIPYNRALGRRLGTSPVATAVLSLLQAAQDDGSGPSLLRVLSSPFLDLGAPPGAASDLDRFLRRQRLTGGIARVLPALRRTAADGDHGGELAAALAKLQELLAPFAVDRTAPLGLWMERLSVLLDRVDLAGRVAAVRGALNINLQAHRKLVETLASLLQAGALFPEYRYTFAEWLVLLKKALLHARFQVPPDDEGGVQMLGMEESVGQPWKEIYVGGLVDGSFPQRLPQNIFLPESVLEQLGVATLETARQAAAFHFYRLLCSAPKVTLTWPENVGDKPVVQSPFLRELAPLRMAGVLNRGPARTAGIQFDLTFGESRSIPEFAKAAALAGIVPGLEEVLRADLPGMAVLRQALLNAQAAPPAAFPARDLQVFRVTDLDAYLSCPYDYYVTRVLGMAPLEEVSEDITPLDRGVVVHGILSAFYRQWERPITAADREACRTLLAELADRAFPDADTFRNRRERARFLSLMAERFLDAEEAFWTQGLRPVLLEEEIPSFPLALSDGATVELHGTIDRIDADRDGNFIIVDYKTGSYPQPKNGTDQEIFQLPVYAVMARHALSRDTGAGRGALLRRPVGLAYYDLSGRVGSLCRDVVLYDRSAGIIQTSTKPDSSSKTAEEFAEILSLSLDRARQAAEGIRAGDFATRPKNEDRCRYCPNAMLCRKDG